MDGARGAKRTHSATGTPDGSEPIAAAALAGACCSTVTATAALSAAPFFGAAAGAGSGDGVATLLAARAAQHGDDAALSELRSDGSDPRVVSYGALLQRVRRAAAVLQASGVGAGGMVGMALPAGVQMIVHQLAAWWAGAGFVPLDVSLPTARLRCLLEDSGATVVVGACADASALSPALPDGVALEVVLADSGDADEAEEGSAGDAAPGPAADFIGGVSHIAYTSGSTGAPKGVVCQHRALVSYCLANAHVHDVTPESRVLLAAAPSFDPSIGEAYTALLAGATLVLAPRAAVTSAMDAVLLAGAVSHVCTTPLLWSQLEGPGAEDFPALRVVTLGGEKVPQKLVETWAESVRLVNVYGTTEGTVYQTSNTYITGASSPSCVGRPLPGVAVAVVRSSGAEVGTLELAVQGELGELVTGGVQTAAGYHGTRLAKESAAAFLPLSALALEPEIAEALKVCTDDAASSVAPFWYRTGDLAVWRSENELEVVGRADSQVKLNGVRVELGEIEENLRRCEALVTGCAVCVAADGKAEALVTLRQELGGEEMSGRLWAVVNKALRLHCEAYLPRAMRPARFAAVGALPLGPTHKLDRSALPALFVAAAGAQDQRVAEDLHLKSCPANDTADQMDDGLLQLVAHAWRSILGLPSELPALTASAEFGALGGDSLTALRVVRELHKSVLLVGGEAMEPQPLPSLDKGMGDLGVITGVLAPGALLRRSKLGAYVAFLSESGIVAPGGSTAVAPHPVVAREAREPESDSNAWARAAVDLEMAACELGAAGAAVVRSLLAAGAPPEPMERVDAAVNAKVGVIGVQQRKRQGGAGKRRVVLAPLHVAAKSGNVEALSALLEAGASLTLATAGTRAMAAHFAAGHSSAALEALLDAGSPLRATDQNKQGLLHVAAREGYTESVALLLQRAGESGAVAVCEQRDRWNRSAVDWACVNGHAGVLKVLISAGGSVQATKMSAQKHHRRTHGRLQPPLHLAVLRATTKDEAGPEAALACVALLLAAKAEVDGADEMGTTAFQVATAAAGAAGEECCRLLVEAGANTRLPAASGGKS